MEQLAHDFWNQKQFAVVGVSITKKKFGYAVFSEMKKRGLDVYPVNKSGNKIGEDLSYSDLRSLPTKVDGVVIIVPKDETNQIVRTCAELNIKNVWIQQGAESDDAIRFCNEHDLNVVHHRCALMYLQPRQFPHSFHHWIHNIFSKENN